MQNDPERPHVCPACQQPMIPHEVKGIALEICNEHGTWLPGDQLGQIVTRVQKEAQSQKSRTKRLTRRLIQRRRKEREGASRSKQTSLVGALFSVIFS